MSALAISSPLPQFFDLDGEPLNSGFLYFGVAGQNPETNPITVYWDVAGTQPAAQPIRTLNGYASRNGTPALLFVTGDYSLTLRNRRRKLIFTLPSGAQTNSAIQLRADLADTTDPAKGAGMIGYNDALTYTGGSIGAWIQALATSAGGFKNLKEDFGCVGDGVADDTTKFQTAITTCENNGWALFGPAGNYKVTATLTQTKRLHFFGEGRGLTVISSSAAVGWLVTVALGYGNTYSYWHDFSIMPSAGGGGTNGFKAVLTAEAASFSYMSNWEMERVEIGDWGGYGINLDNGVGNLNGFFRCSIRECWITNGAILNKAGDSIDVSNNTVTDGATIRAAHAGGRVGFLYTGLPGARQVVFSNNNVTTSGGAFACFSAEQLRLVDNQIEHPIYYQLPYYAASLTYGASVYLNNCPGAVLRDNTIGAGGATTVGPFTGTLTIGSNSVTGMSSTVGLYIGCTVKGTGIPTSTRIQNIVGTTITLTNNATANGVQSLTFGYSPDSSVYLDNGTINTTMDTNELASGAHWHYTIAAGSYNNNTSGTCVYTGLSTTVQINDQNTGAVYNSIEDPSSAYPEGNLYFNPFTDIWNGTDPTNTFCAGITPNGAATASRSTGTVYPGNPSQVSLSINSNGTTINNGCDIVPANQPWRDTGWISGCVAIYTNSATTGGVDVFFVNGATVTLVGRAAVAGGWTLIRFRCRINAGNNWSVRTATSNGSGTYTSGWGYFIGGVHLCRGPYMPSTIEEAPSRTRFPITGGVGFAPSFLGQHAFLTGTGKVYWASNSLLSTDWLILN